MTDAVVKRWYQLTVEQLPVGPLKISLYDRYRRFCYAQSYSCVGFTIRLRERWLKQWLDDPDEWKGQGPLSW